jgi:hypothetical protein
MQGRMLQKRDVSGRFSNITGQPWPFVEPTPGQREETQERLGRLD